MDLSESVVKYQKIQIVIIIVAILFLFFGNFAGAYYGTSSTTRLRSEYDVSTGRYKPVYQNKYGGYYWYVRLGSGVVESIMILLGLGAFGYALKASFESYNAAGVGSIESIKVDTEKSIIGAKFAVALSVFGAVMFIIMYNDANEWWLDSGFYGAFIGGLLAIYFGKRIIGILE